MIITSQLIKNPHGFSTRLGGVSTGIYDSLNLGMNREDDKEKVIKNWDIFLDEVGISQRDFVCGAQVHGSYVHVATRANLRKAYGEGELIKADGYVTNEAGVALATFTADCVPLLMEDYDNHVIASIHCGWRSTVADIEKNAIDAMVGLGADLKNIRASIGPAIGYCCFEVGYEVVEATATLLSGDMSGLYKSGSGLGKYMLDLRGVVKRRLMQLGVSEANIEIKPDCTMCSPDRFWSHRYTSGQRGSQANIIMIK